MGYVTVVELLALLVPLAQVQGVEVEEGAVVAVTLGAVAVLLVVLQGFLVQMIGLVQCKTIFHCS